MRVASSSVLKAFAIVFALTIASAALAASGMSAADTAALKNYVLDAGKVAKYIAGLNALADAKAMDPAIARELEAADNEPQRTLADLKAKLTKHPKLFAPYQRQGLAADDVVLIPLSMFNASIAAEINSPAVAAMVSPAQTAFVKAHPDLGEMIQDASERLENDEADSDDR